VTEIHETAGTEEETEAEIVETVTTEIAETAETAEILEDLLESASFVEKKATGLAIAPIPITETSASIAANTDTWLVNAKLQEVLASTPTAEEAEAEAVAPVHALSLVPVLDPVLAPDPEILDLAPDPPVRKSKSAPDPLHLAKLLKNPLKK